MTDFDHDRDDEFVSAYLDGEATEAERTLVDGDPRLQERVAELRAVATAVGQPTAPPTSAADAAISRALAAAGPVAPVVSLDAARRRRQRMIVVVTSAAAAVVVLVLALPALLRDEGSGDQTALETAPDDADGADAALDEEPPTESASGQDQENGDGLPAGSTPLSTVAPAATSVPLPTLSEPAPPDDLGSLATRAEAQLAVSAAVDEALAAAALRDDEARLYRSLSDATCDTLLHGEDDELVGLVYAGEVVIAGEPHQVLLYELVQTGAQNGMHRLYEIGPDCSRVSVETL